MYRYLNKNPESRDVEDCTVRSISVAQGKTWDATYNELSDLARDKGLMFSSTEFIDSYLDERYERTCYKNNKVAMTVGEFVETHPTGTYLITMRNHITCAKNGVLYDTWDPSDRLIWCAWEVNGQE